MTRARVVPNGSLYLITGCIKARSWGIAVFDRPSATEDYLHFISNEGSNNMQTSRLKCSWIKSGPALSKSGPSPKDMIPGSDDQMNQCLFLRGYRIMLGQDAWDALTNSPATSPQERAPIPRFSRSARRNTVKFDGIFRSLVPAHGKNTATPSSIRRESGSAIINDSVGTTQLVVLSSVQHLIHFSYTGRYTLRTQSTRCY